MIDFGAVHIRLGMLEQDCRTHSLQMLVSAVNIPLISLVFNLNIFYSAQWIRVKLNSQYPRFQKWHCME